MKLNVIGRIGRIWHKLTTSKLKLDEELCLQGEVKLCSQELSVYGLYGYENGRIVNRLNDERTVSIRKTGGQLYIDGKIVKLSASGDLIQRNEKTRVPLSASISDFLFANQSFIPYTWALECERSCSRHQGIVFLGTTWVHNENHACRTLNYDTEGRWYYSRWHDSTWCKESGHDNRVFSAYVEI